MKTKRHVRMAQAELNAFDEKLKLFASALSQKERRLLNLAMPYSSRQSSKRKELVKDGSGAVSPDAHTIQDSSGTIVCGAGYHSERVKTNKGAFVWLCVPNKL